MALAVAVPVGCGANGEGAGDARGEVRLSEQAERLAGVVDDLRRGGQVVVFRHAATDSSMDTTDDLSDCSRQRNLSAVGRRQSRRIGRAFERLGIPVGRVLASPFCRTRDTARLAFGRLRASRALLSIEFRDGPDRRPPPLARLLATEPRRGVNAVLVSHGSAIDEATGVNPEEGGAVVAAPGAGRRGFEIVATPSAGDWPAVVRAAPAAGENGGERTGDRAGS